MKKLILIIGVIINTPNVTFSQCFSTAVNYAVETQTRALTSGDINGDGKIDLVTANKLLIGNGSGGFTTSTISNLYSNGVYDIISADFNNDGKLDLVMAAGDVYLLIGNGTGGFSLPTSISSVNSGFSVKRIVVADFNNDGKKDLAALSDTEMKVLIGNGVGGFSVSPVTTLSGNSGFGSITTADFNADGKMDLVTSKCVGFNSCLGYLSIFIGNGMGGFSATTDIQNGFYPQSITSADLNNDGKIDIATLNSGSLSIALGNGFGGFSVNTIYDGGSDKNFITTGDFNNDGNLDLVLRSGVSSTSILLGDGSGTYSAFPNFDYNYVINSESSGIAVVAADFNGDGKMDLATSNSIAGSVGVFLGVIKIVTTQTNVSTCFGGNNGTATATGACGTNFSYSWNTSPIQTSATATGLSAGTYTVTVTQGNTSNSSTITITQPNEITVNTTSINESCIGGGNNGTATVSVLGGTPPYTFAWNTTPIQTTQTASNLSAGSYNVIVTDANGCTKNSNVQVNYTPNPSSFLYTTNGMVVSFSKNGSGCNSFVWDFGNGNTSTINPNPTVTYLAAGTYGVCLQCNGQSTECVQCLNISVPSNTSGGTLTITGIEEGQLISDIKVYPNPTSDFITIEAESKKDNSNYVILNSIGQQILSGQLVDKKTNIDMRNLLKGIYIIQIGDTEKYCFKLIKN